MRSLSISKSIDSIGSFEARPAVSRLDRLTVTIVNIHS